MGPSVENGVEYTHPLRKEKEGEKSLESFVLHRQLRQPNVRIIGSQGCILYTEDGHEIVDGSSGAAVSCIGHNQKRVHKAIMEQLAQVEYCYAYYFTTPVAEELAKTLSDSTNGEMSRVYIVGSGKPVSMICTH